MANTTSQGYNPHHAGYYFALNRMFQEIKHYRKQTLHYLSASQPADHRNPFYASDLAHTADWYHARAMHYKQTTERWFTQACQYYQAANGRAMDLNLKEFLHTLTYDGENTFYKTNRPTGYNALTWFVKRLPALQMKTQEVLDPIELRQRFYRGQEAIDWSRCRLSRAAPQSEPQTEPIQLALNLFEWAGGDPERPTQ